MLILWRGNGRLNFHHVQMGQVKDPTNVMTSEC